jgi:hypothetical protein
LCVRRTDTVGDMVNGEIRELHDPDGSVVWNVAFDLSPQQLRAAVHAAAEVILERHRGAALETEGVLALRDLTGVRDELDRLADVGANAHVVLTLSRFIVLHDAVDEYVVSRAGRDWAREADAEALPVLDAMLPPMAALRAQALARALGSQADVSN